MSLNCNIQLYDISPTECIGTSLLKIEGNDTTLRDSLTAHCVAINSLSAALSVSATNLQQQIDALNFVPLGGIIVYQFPDTSFRISRYNSAETYNSATINIGIATGDPLYLTDDNSWQVCNGAFWYTNFANRTPDLRGMFVIGAGNYAGTDGSQTFTYGASAGEVKHTLTIAEMPTHNHTATGQGVTDGGTLRDGTRDPVKTHWVQSAGSVSIGNAGLSQSHNNVPQSQVLLYIQKVK